MACAPTTPTPGAGPIIEVIEDTFRVPALITPLSSPLAPPDVRPSVGGTQAGIPAASPTFAAGVSQLPANTAAPNAEPAATPAVPPAAPDGQTPLPRLSPTVPPAAATGNAPATLIRETAQSGATPSPSATLSPGATTTGSPLAIRNDQSCPDTEGGVLYIFGEIVNSSSQFYDIDDIEVTIYGLTGVIPLLHESLDMPGDYFVPPNNTMPFQITAQLEQLDFIDYNLSISAEPSQHSPRDDLTIELAGTTEEEGDLLVDVTWTNPSLVSTYVAPFVVAYDAQRRVSNLAYEPLAGSHTYTGTHTIEMTLYANPCWSADDMLVTGIVGE
ncbi:MAG TPA: hypothetical protein VFL17_08725 [Anaerolineae bacterium]|nr:hypothetical protein [Anaerolineae bacterium]